MEHICTEKLKRDIPANLDAILESIAHTTMYDMLENFGIDDKLLDIAPTMLKNPAEIAGIIHGIRSKFLFQWAEDLMGILATNQELRETFQKNPQLASNVAIGIVNNVPFFKNLCDDLGCSNEVLKIITELVKTPEKTKQILHDINTYNYGGLIKGALELIGEDESLQQYLQENGEAYKTLVLAIFRQLDPMINMKKIMGLMIKI